MTKVRDKCGGERLRVGNAPENDGVPEEDVVVGPPDSPTGGPSCIRLKSLMSLRPSGVA